MGNDQIRFDLSIRAHGNYNIITPIREIQNITKNVRAYEEDYLQDKGFKVSSLHKKYSINENLMGATISGSEIDEWEEPSSESFVLCKLPHQYPKKPKTLKRNIQESTATDAAATPLQPGHAHTSTATAGAAARCLRKSSRRWR